MSEEPTERDMEALTAVIHAGSVHRLGMSSGPCDICAKPARTVLASDWYAERIAQARREGAATAPIADEVTAINALREIRALLDETPTHPNDGLRTSIGAILRAALRGDA